MKSGGRSRCISIKRYGTAMSGNKLELCTFAAESPRMSEFSAVRVLFWGDKETPGNVVLTLQLSCKC